MSTPQLILAIVGAIIAALGVGGPIGALTLKLFQIRQRSRERLEREKLALNGKTTPTLVEMVRDLTDENRKLRDMLQVVAEGLGSEVGKRARAASDPKGIPVQREDTGRHRQRDDTGRHRAHREIEMRTDVESERPFPPPRPRRRTRDE